MITKTRALANAGLASGGITIIAALIAMVTYLSNTDNLYALVLAIGKLHHGVELSDADLRALVQLGAIIMGLLGAIIVSLVAAFLGKSPLPTPPPPGSS